MIGIYYDEGRILIVFQSLPLHGGRPKACSLKCIRIISDSNLVVLCISPRRSFGSSSLFAPRPSCKLLWNRFVRRAGNRVSGGTTGIFSPMFDHGRRFCQLGKWERFMSQECATEEHLVLVSSIEYCTAVTAIQDESAVSTVNHGERYHRFVIHVDGGPAGIHASSIQSFHVP